MNTEIHYMYRDGSNYKMHHREVVAGVITHADIAACLEEGENFIPSQVGLLDLQEMLEGGVGDDDHVWHELQEDDFTPTQDAPTAQVTADELIRNFIDSKHNWLVEQAMDLIGLPR